MNLTNVFDGYRQKVLELLQKAYDNDTSNNTNVQSLLQLILADLDLKANLDEIQPTALYIVKDGTLTPVELDSSAPHTNVPIPVVITDINGSAVVNVTAGDLYVNIRHDGTDPSSVRIGDGTEIMLVNPDGSINVVTSSTIPTSMAHLYNGTISNAAATQIDATSHVCKRATITASELNTGWIRIGGSTLTATTGFILYAGESYDIDISNTNVIYAWAEILNEEVSVTYYN